MKSKRFFIAAGATALVLIFIVVLVASRKQIEDPGVPEPEAPLHNGITNQTPEFSAHLTKVTGEDLATIATSSKGLQLLLTSPVVASNQNDVPTAVDTENTANVSKLSLYDPNNKTLTEIATNIYRASFFDDTTIYYQKTGAGAGVYFYDLTGKKEQLIQNTYDQLAFFNIAMIDKTRFFFIQATTGKIGFAKVGSSETTVLAEKQFPTQGNYARIGAFKYAGTSPDKKLVAFYEYLQSEPNATSSKVKLRLLPTAAKSLSEAIFESDFEIVGTGLDSLQNIFQWSKDGKLLLEGISGHIIDLSVKKPYTAVDVGLRSVSLSPDGKRGAAASFNKDESYIFDLNLEGLKEENKQVFGPIVRQLHWITSSDLIFTIGKKIYLYSVTEKKLYLALSDREEYTILAVNSEAGTALVTFNNKLLNLTLKK